MKIRLISTAVSVVALLGAFASPVAMSATAEEIAEGQKYAFDRKLGNCLGCHMIAGGEMPGTIGPPLIAMKARFPDKEVLRAQIHDATARNPASMMPPFGKHGVLTEHQLDLVTEYIHTL